MASIFDIINNDKLKKEYQNNQKKENNNNNKHKASYNKEGNNKPYKKPYHKPYSRYYDLLNTYKKNSDLLLNYGICKAYFKQSSISVAQLAEMIVTMKFNLPWQKAIVRSAISKIEGKHNATLIIPQFNFKDKVCDILANFVYRNFDTIMADKEVNKTYPMKFYEFVEKNKGLIKPIKF